MNNELIMWYEYDYKTTYFDGTEHFGHYETENEKEVIKRLLTTFFEQQNGFCKIKVLEPKVIDGLQYCNIYVKYVDGDGLQTAKFGNIPFQWNENIDVWRIATLND